MTPMFSVNSWIDLLVKCFQGVRTDWRTLLKIPQNGSNDLQYTALEIINYKSVSAQIRKQLTRDFNREVSNSFSARSTGPDQKKKKKSLLTNNRTTPRNCVHLSAFSKRYILNAQMGWTYINTDEQAAIHYHTLTNTGLKTTPQKYF